MEIEGRKVYIGNGCGSSCGDWNGWVHEEWEDAWRASGKKHGVVEEGLAFTLDQLAARDKELAAANVEAGAVQMREAADKYLEELLPDLSKPSDGTIARYIKRNLAKIQSPTTTLDALLKEERAKVIARVGKVRDEILAEIERMGPQHKSLGKRGCVKRLDEIIAEEG